jgi:UDP-2-acetamido-3-amino-2,3-dideoxy-glucuronate N-acetyltransferase
VILPCVRIGAGAMVGAGAVVTRSVPPGAIIVGNPARIAGYAGAGRPDENALHSLSQGTPASLGAQQTAVNGVTLHRLPQITDMRGSVSVGEFEKSVSFTPLRYFLVFGVPSEETRGEHAHHKCQQFLICVRGRCSVVADDGRNRQEFLLDSPTTGLYLPPMIWGIQYRYSTDAVLLVFASEYYDANDYIRNYGEFLKLNGAEE